MRRLLLTLKLIVAIHHVKCHVGNRSVWLIKAFQSMKKPVDEVSTKVLWSIWVVFQRVFTHRDVLPLPHILEVIEPVAVEIVLFFCFEKICPSNMLSFLCRLAVLNLKLPGSVSFNERLLKSARLFSLSDLLIGAHLARGSHSPSILLRSWIELLQGFDLRKLESCCFFWLCLILVYLHFHIRSWNSKVCMALLILLESNLALRFGKLLLW